ncbi:hypothetical protein A2U01_0118568, partial [Trifolium medium]|nr:hypothetical protein [Trifolium medium]
MPRARKAPKMADRVAAVEERLAGVEASILSLREFIG